MSGFVIYAVIGLFVSYKLYKHDPEIPPLLVLLMWPFMLVVLIFFVINYSVAEAYDALLKKPSRKDSSNPR